MGRRTIEVALIGLPKQEVRILASLSQISTIRPRAYVFGWPQDLYDPKIFLVDVDERQALKEWRNAYRRPGVLAIAVSADGLMPQDCVRAIKRPIVPSHLLGLLDEAGSAACDVRASVPSHAGR